MGSVSVLTNGGGSVYVPEEQIAELQGVLRGDLLVDGDAGYDEGRSVWNGMIDKRPALIAMCEGASDVVALVKLATAHDLVLSVRGGGHNASGIATNDGGLVINLTRMNGVHVDVENRTARAEGGCVWSDVDKETLLRGLATTGGTVSNTGIAGLTLGGGLGWAMAEHGITADNLLSADVVTATGEVVTASETQNQDLLWGLRGGGGNFGVVTSFEYRLHEQGNVYGGLLMYPRAMAREVMKFYAEFTADLPDKLTVFCGLLSSPEGDPMIALIIGYFGDVAGGEAAVQPMRDFAEPVADMVGEIPYAVLQSFLDENAAPHGPRRYWKSGYIPEITDEFIDIVVEKAETMTAPKSVVLLFHMHGEATRVAADATAFSMRDNVYDFDIIAQWDDDAEDDHWRDWTRDYWNSVEKFSAEISYINHLMTDDVERVRPSFGPNYGRLVELKREWDQSNLFRLNPNINPA
jgi:FAD/FMN-containing dehydrogenase